MATEQKRVRVAMIGAGKLAGMYHYPVLASLPDVEIAAVCDLSGERAQEAAATYGIGATYSDHRKMLDEVRPDAVWCIMPPQYLYEPASDVIKHGCHLFIEKPLALTLVQARMLAWLADKHKVLTAVGFQRRHIPALTDYRRRIEERGPIHHAAVSFVKHTPNLDAPAGHYGGICDSLWVDGVHAVDNVRWLCGGEVETVAAAVRTRYVPGPVPNEFNALITFSTGATGILQFSYMTGRRQFRVEAHGKNATAIVDPDGESMLSLDGKIVEHRSSQEWGAGVPGSFDSNAAWVGFWHEIRDFIDCVREGRQPSSHFGDAVKTMELVERIIQAGRAD